MSVKEDDVSKVVLKCGACHSVHLEKLSPGFYRCLSCGVKQYLTEEVAEKVVEHELARPPVPEEPEKVQQPLVPPEPEKEREPLVPPEPERKGRPRTLWILAALVIGGLVCCVCPYAQSALLSLVSTGLGTPIPPIEAQPTGELVVMVYRSEGGLQTVGAEIFVYPTGFRAEEVASSKDNPASFSLRPGVYDVVASYEYRGDGRRKVEGKVEDIAVNEDETTEVAISMHLGSLTLIRATQSAFCWIVYVYPDYQHDDAIASTANICRPGDKASFLLPAGVYDLSASRDASGPWIEGVVVNEGQDTEVVLEWPE